MAQTKILFAGSLDRGSTALHRMKALVRLGYDVTPFDFIDYKSKLGRIGNWIYHRLMIGPAIEHLNDGLRRAAADVRPDYIFIDKGLFVTSSTVKYISRSIAPVLHYNIDNPFGYRSDPGWRLFLDAIPFYDVHFVPRVSSIQDLKSAGAKAVFLLPLAYEPSVHYPPPPSWGDDDRIVDVSFTGSPYDDRATFLTNLLKEHGIATNIRGSRWEKVLGRDVVDILYRGGPLYEDEYRMRIWESKICLSFVTHSNLEQVAHKSFEIAAAGGFLLAEATEEHLKTFEEGKEALFFSDVADCARLIKKYLPDRAFREKVSAAARHRAVECGYSNDQRLKNAFEHLLTN